MNDLPRSALLAAWGSAVLDGRVRPDRALAAVHRDDEPHEVATTAGLPPHLEDVGDLDLLLRRFVESGARSLRVVLPAPGDPGGLPGPALVTQDAVDAGECVLVLADQPLALVPQVRRFGSELEPGHQVCWQVHLAGTPRLTDQDDLPTVESRLRRALAEATEVLADLDVARWRPDAAAALQALREDPGPARALPPGSPPRAARVLDLACRVRAIVSLATVDDGGVVNLWEGTRRTEALRGLDTAGRQAVAAAVNACEPADGDRVGAVADVRP